MGVLTLVGLVPASGDIPPPPHLLVPPLVGINYQLVGISPLVDTNYN